MHCVLKDPEIIKKWQKAVHRDDIVLKHGHKVCEKHFAKDDILWTREFKAADGSVIGVVSF